MDIIGIFILVTLVLILYMITTYEYETRSTSYSPSNGPVSKKHKLQPMFNDNISLCTNPDTKMSLFTNKSVNNNFINNQFHNDYRDVMNAILNLIPDKKQIFNISNIPLKYSEPPITEVNSVVQDFIKVLNTNIKDQVSNVRNPNSGWDEAVVEPTVKSGWDKIQESLGLNPSLWGKPANKANVILKQIKYVQKYETEDEIKYSVDLIIQKVNVKDQMVIKCSFVIDKRPLFNENNFFISKKVDMRLIIEDITIVGYLSNDGNDSRLMFDKDMDKFYDYNEMEYNNMTDPKLVQEILMKKYAQRTNEMQLRNAMLDEEGQAFHKTLPSVYDYSNIQATQTIIADMNNNGRVFI